LAQELQAPLRFPRMLLPGAPHAAEVGRTGVHAPDEPGPREAGRSAEKGPAAPSPQQPQPRVRYAWGDAQPSEDPSAWRGSLCTIESPTSAQTTQDPSDWQHGEEMSVASGSVAACAPAPRAAAATIPALFSGRLSVPVQLLSESLDNRRAFVCAPLLPGAGSLKARLVRLASSFFGSPRYALYAEGEGEGNHTLLLAADRQEFTKSLGPSYAFTLAAQHCSSRSSSHLGKMYGNLRCTKYTLFGPSCKRDNSNPQRPREELAAVRFRKPDDSPRRMEVALPRVADDGSRQECRPGKDGGGLWRAWEPGTPARSQEDPGGFHRLSSAGATWDEEGKCYAMDFFGRVTLASSRNFQLVAADTDFGAEGNDLRMQFGRCSWHVFSLDVAFPLSPLQAFAIALSTFDARIAETFKMYY